MGDDAEIIVEDKSEAEAPLTPIKATTAEEFQKIIDELDGEIEDTPVKSQVQIMLDFLIDAIAQCGSFACDLTTRHFVSPEKEENDWVQPFNQLYDLLQGQKDFTAETDQKLMETMLTLGDGGWIQFCGIPKVMGLVMHVANVKTKKGLKAREIFRNKVYRNINSDGFLLKPKSIFRELQLNYRIFSHVVGSELVSPLCTGVKGRLAAGKYLTEKGFGGCRVEKKAHWRQERAGKEVSIYQIITPDRTFVIPAIFPLHHAHRKHEVFIKTQHAIKAFTVAQEKRAMKKLKRMLTREQYANYLLSGVIEELSAKSGVIYFVRRLKPTLAYRRVQDNEKGEDRYEFLASLCMHPMAYYMDSFVGCLCPTDDVISHLLWIRGDERRFWGKANHHTVNHVEAGIP